MKLYYYGYEQSSVIKEVFEFYKYIGDEYERENTIVMDLLFFIWWNQLWYSRFNQW